MLQALKLSDVWRVLPPQDLDYSHFYSLHRVYSRIDFFLIHQSSLPQILNVAIGNVTFSDHAPIHLTMPLGPQSYSPFSWKLNESLLQDQSVVGELTRELQDYFQANAVDVQDPST